MLNCENRRKEILTIIEENKHASIEKLCSIFNVNEQVIYRDLIYLEKINKIKRTSKGAIYPESKTKKNALKLKQRETTFFKEKEAIGKFASTLINDGESLMIDGGSTTIVFTTNIVHKNRMMVITNTSTIGSILKKGKRNRIILTGGQLLKNTYTTVGDLAESVISQYRVNKAVISVCSINIDEGSFYTNIEEEAKIKQAMIKSANEVIIIADSSKTEKENVNFVCDFTLNKKLTLITDNKLSKEKKAALEAKKITVITVE